MSMTLKFKGVNDEVVSVGRTTGLFRDKYYHEIPVKPTAEEMLKKALEFVDIEIDKLLLYSDELNEFDRGVLQAYRYTASHLEMLIKEAKQND